MKYLISVLIALMFCAGAASAQQRQYTSPVQPAPRTMDVVAPFGVIQSVVINEPSSNEFSSFHGLLNVSYGGNQTVLYRWGGSSCPGRNLREMSQKMLQDALANNLKVRVQTKNGAGGSLCIVGVEYAR